MAAELHIDQASGPSGQPGFSGLVNEPNAIIEPDYAITLTVEETHTILVALLQQTKMCIGARAAVNFLERQDALQVRWKNVAYYDLLELLARDVNFFYWFFEASDADGRWNYAVADEANRLFWEVSKEKLSRLRVWDAREVAKDPVMQKHAKRAVSRASSILGGIREDEARRAAPPPKYGLTKAIIRWLRQLCRLVF